MTTATMAKTSFSPMFFARKNMDVVGMLQPKENDLSGQAG